MDQKDIDMAIELAKQVIAEYVAGDRQPCRLECRSVAQMRFYFALLTKCDEAAELFVAEGLHVGTAVVLGVPQLLFFKPEDLIAAGGGILTENQAIDLMNGLKAVENESDDIKSAVIDAHLARARGEKLQ